MSEKKYRLNIQERYFSDAQGNTFFREPLKDASGYADIPFMNFCPQLVQLLRRDDGFTITEKILFSAFRGGRNEPPVELEKRDMIGNQPHVKFSPGCRVFQGKGNCAKCGEMMAMQCEDAEIKTVYTHTGWKVIDGQRVFLNGENSVTVGGLTDRYSVELAPDLSRCYRFTPCEDDTNECFKTLLERMPKAAPDWLIIPSLAYCFMSPLNGMLRELGAEPSFSFYLIGKTGSFKSSWSKVLLSFFGRLGYAETAPCTFLDTQNAVGRKLALAADVPLLLDDRRPTSNAADKLRYEGLEKFASSAIGDRAARGRANVDGGLRESYVARSNLIVTAEEAFLNIGSSAVARSVSVELQPDSVSLEGLQELQARPEHLNRIMQMFIQWLIERWDNLRACVLDKLAEYRAIFADAGHPRLATAFSQLMLGYAMYLAFLQDYGQIDKLEAVTMKTRAQAVFLEMCERQTEKVEGEKPTRLFVELLRELLETKQARLCDARPRTVAGITTENEISAPNTIGYEDDEFFYLIPRTAYSAVTAFYAKSGYTFPASSSVLWKMFMDEGAIKPDGKRPDRRHTFKGKSGRYIHLYRHVMGEADGNEE